VLGFPIGPFPLPNPFPFPLLRFLLPGHDTCLHLLTNTDTHEHNVRYISLSDAERLSSTVPKLCLVEFSNNCSGSLYQSQLSDRDQHFCVVTVILHCQRGCVTTKRKDATLPQSFTSNPIAFVSEPYCFSQTRWMARWHDWRGTQYNLPSNAPQTLRIVMPEILTEESRLAHLHFLDEAP
jgi:hypothetical protein